MTSLFTPAIRLMNQLKYPEKFLLVGIILVLPLSVVLTQYIAQANLVIDFAAREQLGLQYNIPVIAFLGDIEAHAGMVVAYAAGNEHFNTQIGSEILKKQADIEADIAAVNVLYANSDRSTAVDGSARWEAIKKEWENVKANLPMLPPNTVSEDYASLIRQTQVLINVVGNSSNQILDPDIDTYYLIDALINKVPTNTITLGGILRYSTAAAAAGSLTSPVARLVTTTRSIRTGDLSRRVNLPIPDELGELAVSFDAMTDQLVNRNVQVRQLYEDQLVETTRRDAVFFSISDALVVLGSDRKIILRNPNADALIKRVAANRQQRQEFIDLCENPEGLYDPKTVHFGINAFRASATQVCMPTGEMLGFVVVFHDITAIIETERLKDDLVKQMSHELRTPLTAIRGYIELIGLLEKDNLSRQGHEFVTRAIENLTVLERTVNDVVDVSGIISNDFHLDITQFSLRQMLNEEVARWMPKMEKRELGLSLMILTPKLRVDADQERLTQVMTHLLRNAYSYTLPGGSIIVTARADDRWAWISITDTGVGIEQDEHEAVFERMYRGRSANAGPTDSRGLGLGLYLSKCIITAHDGTITLESQPNKGTIVTVVIPRTVRHG